MRGSPSQAANPAALPLSDLPMTSWHNREAQLLKIGDKIEHVTKTQALILDALLQVPGKVCTMTDLIYQVYMAWDRDEPDSAESSLKAQICYLRRGGVPIVAVNGSGYFLGRPQADLEPGETYRGRDDVGRWHCLKVYREPVAVLVNDDGETHYVPMSSARFWELARDDHGYGLDAGRAPEPLEDSPGALPSSPTFPTM